MAPSPLVTVLVPTRTVSRLVTDLDLTRYDAVLFDLDGVLTDTASLHASAWKRMFDEFLKRWSAEHGHPFTPFRIDPDYLQYVDGKPRIEGVASFLESRRIVLPEGAPERPAGRRHDPRPRAPARTSWSCA